MKGRYLAVAVIITWIIYFACAMTLGFESWIVKTLSLTFIILWAILLFKGWKTKEKNNDILG
ncbi:hypothetical protein DVB69_09785 [Sporosarcina sp. BI001-red]|uniref:hypothetical protein n=1 Tax=Sporosarcina sp. BI001-red TaxID=2282866 RepID=UPI000E228D35|nr:hypothetical protein [Sporosarcina sp. BI001-red]REB07137.1 hypothetical protein DVB69_09785 [Sporosarcina sp. BI001-red]